MLNKMFRFHSKISHSMFINLNSVLQFRRETDKVNASKRKRGRERGRGDKEIF